MKKYKVKTIGLTKLENTLNELSKTHNVEQIILDYVEDSEKLCHIVCVEYNNSHLKDVNSLLTSLKEE